MSIDSETRSILDKPVPRTIQPLIFFSRQPILTYSKVGRYCTCIFTGNHPSAHILDDGETCSSPPVDMWDWRWAPAYQWDACILSKEFRQNSTDHYFQIHSKPTWYRSEAP